MIKKIENKHLYEFIVFDGKDFYHLVTESLVRKAIRLAKSVLRKEIPKTCSIQEKIFYVKKQCFEFKKEGIMGVMHYGILFWCKNL